MFGRYLTIAMFIGAGAATLTACGGRPGGKVTLQKTLGPGGRDFVRAKNSKVPTGACLNLPERVTQLRAETGGLALHSRDYDLGQVTTAARDHRVGFTSDAASRELRERRALTGENAPVYRVTLTPDDLLGAAPLAGVLGIASQDGCAAVTFKGGAKFKVERGDARSLNLIDPTTHEQREYIWGTDNLVINVFAPVKLKNCDGQPSPARTERISMRVTWGEQVGVVKLADAYAKILDVPALSTYPQFQEKTKAAVARAATSKCEP